MAPRREDLEHEADDDDPGSGVLTRWLLQNGLVDEMTLITIPVVLGQGMRLFPETGPEAALSMVESRAILNS